MSWSDIFDIAWKICVVVTPMLLGAAVLWLKSQFTTKGEAAAEKIRVDSRFETEQVRVNGDIKRIEAACSNHETRLQLVEADNRKPPSRHQLNNELQKVVAGQASLDKSIEGLTKQVDTLAEYLHTLIERGIQHK